MVRRTSTRPHSSPPRPWCFLSCQSCLVSCLFSCPGQFLAGKESTSHWAVGGLGRSVYTSISPPLLPGHEFHMALTKGCTRDMNKKAQLTRHRTGPGISIVSYMHVCRDRDFCNDLSTTDTLWTSPPDTGTRGGKSLEKGKGLSEGNTGL